MDVDAWNVDLLSLSAHKLYGPKGMGALYVCRGERRIRLEPLLDGGGHEGRLRSGTLPVPLIVGLGRACELLLELVTNHDEGCHAVTPEAGRHGGCHWWLARQCKRDHARHWRTSRQWHPFTNF